MRRYRVTRRDDLVAFIARALRDSGAEILSLPDPQSAPFEFGIRTPSGERLHLICYAFLANKYRQRNRPADEHRFQIKYGSDFTTLHELLIAEEPGRLTLFFGAHLEEGVCVACDPAMHRWTRFSRSVEFKTRDIDEAKRKGWHGWERDRRRGRDVAPKEDLRTESLLGFTPSNFLRYVAFERIATGMDPSERLLLADRISAGGTGTVSVPAHPLEAELGLSAFQILDLIGDAFRLKVAVRGSAANHHLAHYLRRRPALRSVRALDEDGKPDFEVVFRGRTVFIECKNVARRPTAGGLPRVDFQKTRASKADACSRYYRRDQFHVLAACLHPVTERWEFRFCATRDLPAHPRCAGRISDRVLVGGQSWHDNVDVVLERVIAGS
jgi:hypothetical protein